MKNLFILFMLVTLNSCILAVAGGAGAGGYYAAKDERTFGTIASDASITAAINVKYVKDDLVSAIDINVDTYEGKVTLTGTVPSKKARGRAITIAKSSKGVKSVTPKLTVVK